jgi:hypothetical protein
MIKVVLASLLFISVICAYDPDFGQNLCRLAVASYCNVSKVKDWTCKPCANSPIKLTNVKPFHNKTGDVFGLIGVSAAPKGICIHMCKCRSGI